MLGYVSLPVLPAFGLSIIPTWYLLSHQGKGFGVRTWVNESMPNCSHDTEPVCGDVWEAPKFSSSTTGWRPTDFPQKSPAPKRYCLELPPPTHLWFQWHFSRFTSRFPSLKMLPHKSGWLFEPASWGPGERGKSFGKNLPIPTTTKARGSSRRVAALLWDPGLQTRWVWTNVFQTF